MRSMLRLRHGIVLGSLFIAARGMPLVLSACGGDSFTVDNNGHPTAGNAGSGGQAGAGGEAGSQAGSGGEAGSQAGAGGEAGSQAGAGGEAGKSGSAGSGQEEPKPTCDENEHPSEGLFVSTSFASGPSAINGSETAPFPTIKQALDTALTKGISTIYIDQGTYTEEVTIPVLPGGITLRGGWNGSVDGWKRNCQSDAHAKTLIVSPSAKGIVIKDTVATTRIETLSVTTKGTGDASESQYALWVSNAASPVELHDVELHAGNGGDGSVAPQSAEPEGVICSAFSHCKGGQEGNPGTSAASPATGTFDASGYVPAHGLPGGNGLPGQNGLNTEKVVTCYNSCQLCLLNSSGCAGDENTASKIVSLGMCGCGGKGGKGGDAGLGGGASVGVFLLGSTTQLKVTSSSIAAGNGGNGANGKPGISGDGGTEGTPGESTACKLGCSKEGFGSICSCILEPATMVQAPAGKLGGTGGKGGDGSSGGGGASVSIVRVGGATVNIDEATQLSFGNAGKGGNGAPDGVSNTQLTVN